MSEDRGLAGMLHDAGQVGFAVYEDKAWILHGEGSFVLVTARAGGLGKDDQGGEFDVQINFEVPDQALAWARITVKGFRRALLYGRQVLVVRSTGASMWECRRVLFGTPASSDARDEGIDTQDSLIADITNWREAFGMTWEGVDALKADLANGGFAMLSDPAMNPEQIRWLKRFISRWELVSAEGRA